MTAVRCPCLLIAAPASGQGKTTVTAALARLHTRLGRRVHVFKCGPDFIDPQMLSAASGTSVYNLDLGMCGEQDAAARLHRAAASADLLLVEGVMGLFDGTPSAADIAMRFGLPVLGVIDVSAMAQTFGAVAHGLATFRPGLPFAGVLANGVGSDGHARMLRDSLPASIAWFGAVPRSQALQLPERHLGLVQAEELVDLETRLDRLADAIAATALVDLPAAVEFAAAMTPPVPPLLAGRTIAIARDAAFSFVYPANLDLLRQLGAEVRFFSPLACELLPECDAVWLPGGYPELHGEALGRHEGLWRNLRAHVDAGRPLLAECGGMMVLFDHLATDAGRYAMAGLLPGSTSLQRRPAAIGLQSVRLPQGTIRGHTFHYSRCETPMTPVQRAQTPDGSAGEAIYRRGSITASYLHFYFPSNPAAAASLFLP
jgi:cobyrinic acid a,c-diamide synthase